MKWIGNEGQKTVSRAGAQLLIEERAIPNLPLAMTPNVVQAIHHWRWFCSAEKMYCCYVVLMSGSWWMNSDWSSKVLSLSYVAYRRCWKHVGLFWTGIEKMWRRYDDGKADQRSSRCRELWRKSLASVVQEICTEKFKRKVLNEGNEELLCSGEI